MVHLLSRLGVAILFGLALCLSTPNLRAQELKHQKHPHSAYIDLRPAQPGQRAQTMPSWVEAVEYVPATNQPPATETMMDGSVAVAAKTRARYRIRLLHPKDSTAEYLQARVFFEDLATAEKPSVAVWNELGSRMTASIPLGQNLGLPSSETLTLPMRDADYLEIETDGDGSQIRGVFVSWLEATEVLQPSDFPSKETVRQPFHIISATRKKKDDSYLYGVVTASLYQGKPLVLQPADADSEPLPFELERQPLMAVVTCEVLGATIDAPPSLTVNGTPAGNFSFSLPDLSDPGYQGLSREGQPKFDFRYTGWLHAQKIISGAQLKAGLNNLSLGLSNWTDAVAIRSVSIQLKYNWEKLDYVLAPAAP